MSPSPAGLLMILVVATEGHGPTRPPTPSAASSIDSRPVLLGRPDGRKVEELRRPFPCRGFAEPSAYLPGEHVPYPPIGNPWPVDVVKAHLVEDPSVAVRLSDYFPRSSLEELRHLLALYLVVSRDDWMHNYSHVGLSDEGGWLVSGSRCFQFVVRPGGLAFVVYPEGTAVYLASCVGDRLPRP